MKTTTRTTLPINPHEQPVREMKLKWYRYLFYFMTVFVPSAYCFAYYDLFLKISPPPSDFTVKQLVICLAISLLGLIIGIATLALALGDIYFYDQHVEMRRFLPFVKRSVIYYDKMHAHIWQNGSVSLNHYETQPNFLKSPYTWFKANFIDAVNIPGFCKPEIREFAKTKAQSVSHYGFMGQKLN